MTSFRKSILIKLCLAALIIGILGNYHTGWSKPASAASGMPNSPEFGYGVRLDLWGQEVELALNAAAGVGVEWVAIDFDWGRHWPDASQPVNLEPLDRVMALAKEQELNVMLSITDAPVWALGEGGPDAGQTAGLATMLATRYPENLLTIELFPGANTLQGWGAPASPAAYTALLQACQTAMLSANSAVMVVAGGLTPLPPQVQPGDMDDLAYLSQLYQSGAAAYMPILSIRLGRVEGEAMSSPTQASQRVLRHYEAIREVMLQAQHNNGLIWITGFVWSDQVDQATVDEQIRWLNQAYHLMKSQLYIGVAFFDRLNPPELDTPPAPKPTSLIVIDEQGTHLHPALAAIGQIITLNQTGHATYQVFLYKKLTTGEAKSLLKRRSV